MSDKERILIFGASTAGIKAYHILKKQYVIGSFLDNDANKHGTELENLKISAPNDINTLQFDKICIASAYQYQILKQLTDELNIPREKIFFIRKQKAVGQDNVYYFSFLTTLILFLCAAGGALYALLNWL
ncbi:MULTISPECIES: nucleoside-diphosphate sugar epimerase/dehydratase [Gammaproteobacteria]|uniref:nucleoside-diphosphate sugar epimerase/dehydratase n=1 Tax=Gammaproteobacteria TaxID=1236 RepID=UPI000DD0A5AC|nr:MULTISPECIES: hypothetical protein [Gammaproteobacteria]RTE86834.1 hypothetical protein DQX04_00105 [Aliidiomarina sp. B3213]TCZ93377.1 hypothetical protein EYQ95_05195 [Lysobacter sp. N42]